MLNILEDYGINMNNLPDIQNLEDTRNKFINKVGIRNLRLPINIVRKNNTDINTIADISVYTSLNKKTKGANMSRYSIVLHEVIKSNIGIDIIEKVLDKLAITLESTDSFIKFKFPYFIEKEAPVSKIKSYMTYDCIISGEMVNNIKTKYLTVNIPYTSLCPCSKEISKHGAHNQLSIATITVELNKFLWIEDIIELVEKSVSCPVWTTLKRPDEKYVTETAYNNPKFCEDIARDISIKLDELINVNTINDYSVVVNHFESIHNHIATAIINKGKKLK